MPGTAWGAATPRGPGARAHARHTHVGTPLAAHRPQPGPRPPPRQRRRGEGLPAARTCTRALAAATPRPGFPPARLSRSHHPR